MTINICGYDAQGPFRVEDTQRLLSSPGVYVVFGDRDDPEGKHSIVDVGMSGDISDRISGHNREDCWNSQGHAQLWVAALYPGTVEESRRIEKEIREELDPPCGER